MLLGFALVFLWCPVTDAEVFMLKDGGQITGTLLNPQELPRQKYLIQMDTGRITLEKSQVEKVVNPSAAEREYEQIAPTFPDTVDGQWKLADWCQEHKLTAQRRTHLERIVELEPDHARARALLGYSKIEGKWMTQKEYQESRGLVRYDSKWITPQEAEIRKKTEKNSLAQKEWIMKIRRWQDKLGTDHDEAAQQNFLAITDPLAVYGLGKALQNDTRLKPRQLYIKVLAKIDTPEAIDTLTYAAVDCEVEEVRLTCLDYLKTKDNPKATKYFVAALRSPNNLAVNRAAAALRVMNDPTTIRPLIDALVTTHRQLVSPESNPGSMSAAFNKNGGAGLSVGGSPKVMKQEVRNPAVLDALLSLTKGVNFDYDVLAWQRWYAGHKPAEAAVSRRSDKAEPSQTPPPVSAPAGRQ
jgi:hypothetical protein